MTPDELRDKAISEISANVGEGPAEPQVVHCEVETEWNESLLRNLSEHRLHVLARSSDIVVFFDENGREIGWRDDGRLGATRPRNFAHEAVRDMIMLELDLPAQTRIDSIRTIELPPLGWTHEAVVHPGPDPGPDQMIRVWISPDDYRVIQCLYGPISGSGPARTETAPS